VKGRREGTFTGEKVSNHLSQGEKDNVRPSEGDKQFQSFQGRKRKSIKKGKTAVLVGGRRKGKTLNCVQKKGEPRKGRGTQKKRGREEWSTFHEKKTLSIKKGKRLKKRRSLQQRGKEEGGPIKKKSHSEEGGIFFG